MISKTDRTICGCCDFWTGDRNPVFDKNGKPKVSINDEIGSCQNTRSKFIDQSRRKDLKCKFFSKWTELL